jgi:hypothetical protein
MEKKTYHYLLMTQQDFFKNDVMEEVLREKAGHYNSRKKNIDFWVLNAPEFIKNHELEQKIKLTNFYVQNRNKISYLVSNTKEIEFYVALVSLDKEFLDWIKLRIGYFENLTGQTNNSDKPSFSYISNGVYGKLQSDQSILLSNPTLLHFDCCKDNFKTVLDIFYLVQNNSKEKILKKEKKI